MALRPTLTRSLVTLGALAGLGAAFLAGTSYGDGADGVGEPGPSGVDAVPAAYVGTDLSLPRSCEELLRWYVDRGVDLVGPYGWDGYVVPLMMSGAVEDSAGMSRAAVPSAEAAGAPAAGPAPVRATNGESGTNVQEAGVDEPDVVKTDGRTLFRVQDGDLVTYDLTGPEVRRLSSLDLPGAGGADTTELLLSGGTVVVVRSLAGGRDGLTSDVLTVDVTDPAAPKLTHQVAYDAALVTARLHDGVVRLVLQAGLPDLDFVQPGRHTTEWEAERANRALVRSSSIEDWLPRAVTDDGPAEQLVDCDQVAVPDHTASLGTLTVVGFDAAAPDAPATTGLAVDTDLAYASTDQLYVAAGPRFWWAGGCLDFCDPTPLPMPERGRTWPRWLPGGSDPETPTGDDDGATHLYAFDLDGIDTTFAASGEVDGVIRDRWSMDAVDGVLRVAVGPSVATGNDNAVVTLRRDGNDLVETGRLDGLGVGEQIQSVRWFDTLAILVTFRQVDPLYAVDLTDPETPRMLGKLKIPGFSAYLHPLGAHRVLGLGEGPGPRGRWGAQAGLFDVTDLTRPTRLDVVSYGSGTTALATLDPRQLTWLPDRRTVLTVVAAYGPEGGYAGHVSVLRLGKGQITNEMVEVEQGTEVGEVRLVPLADGRVVLVTGEDAWFFDV